MGSRPRNYFLSCHTFSLSSSRLSMPRSLHFAFSPVGSTARVKPHRRDADVEVARHLGLRHAGNEQRLDAAGLGANLRRCASIGAFGAVSVQFFTFLRKGMEPRAVMEDKSL